MPVCRQKLSSVASSGTRWSEIAVVSRPASSVSCSLIARFPRGALQTRRGWDQPCDLTSVYDHDGGKSPTARWPTPMTHRHEGRALTAVTL